MLQEISMQLTRDKRLEKEAEKEARTSEKVQKREKSIGQTGTSAREVDEEDTRLS